MAAISWPETVPNKFLLGSFQLIPPERTISSQTDSGLARTRKVFTAAAYQYAGSISMTATEMAALLNFRDMIGGARFNWVEPVYGLTIEARFVPGRQGAPTPHPQGPGRWVVPVVLEGPP